jgi:serine/threonine protein kinase
MEKLNFSGGFSTVYKAWSHAQKQFVALKVIPKKDLSSSQVMIVY